MIVEKVVLYFFPSLDTTVTPPTFTTGLNRAPLEPSLAVVNWEPLERSLLVVNWKPLEHSVLGFKFILLLSAFKIDPC